MATLTRSMRIKIVTAVMEHWKKTQSSLTATTHLLATQIIDAYVLETSQAFLLKHGSCTAFGEIPPEWLTPTDRIIWHDEEGARQYLDLQSEVRAPHELTYYGAGWTLKDKTLKQAYDTLKATSAANDEEEFTIKVQVQTVVNRHKTTESLIEAWPEVAQFVVGAPPKVASADTRDLSQKLGLIADDRS